jgi:hypothetical protein
LSKYVILRLAGKYILTVFKCIAHIKENFGNTKLYNVELFNNADGVLYDVTAQEKHVNNNLKNELENVRKFSMLHGLDAIWLHKSFLCKILVKKRPDVVVYSSSKLEHNGYKRCFGVLDENIIYSGIARHDRDWIRFVCNFSTEGTNKLFSSFVFIIGGPASPYNTPERKKEMLKNIYDVVYTKYNIKLVVKTHPKESIKGLDMDIYKDAFGIDNYGKTWMFSNKSPFILGERAIFSCSFGSGVSLDMLAINKPTIDCLNLRGLALYDTNTSLRNELNDPVFPISYAKLVLVASSQLELDQHVKSVLTKYEAIVNVLRSRYDSYFGSFNNSPEIIANDIYEKIN